MDSIDCERCKLILDVATEGFWDWNLKTNQTYLSPRYCELIGYSPDVFDRAFLKQIIHPDDHQHFFSVIDELIQGIRAISATEFRMITGDGSLRWIEGRGKVIEYDEQGKPARIVGTIVDITERKQTERKLSDNSRFLEDMIENSGMLIAVKSQEGRYEIVNRRWEEVTGLSRQEVLGRSDEEIFPYPVGMQLRLNDLEAMESGHCIEKEEMLDDEIRGRLYGLSTKFALKNIDGSIRGICVMSIDITERKQAELRLQKSEEEKLALERQFHQAQKLESLGLMAGGIAHDFNNLLQSILGNIELASMRLASDSAPQKYLSNAAISGRHAEQLTNLMLTYAGKRFITKKKLHLNKMIRENLELLKTAASAAISIELRLSAEQSVILADEAQILQVVMNLLTNAAESIEEQPGVIKLTTRIQNCDQSFLAKSLLNGKPEPGCYLLFEVSDNGCGMSAETISRLFDPFFTTKFVGRGLGMSAVMGIIRAHHGALFVESEVGKGTTFRVLFPIPESAPSDALQEPIQPSPEKNALAENPLSGMVLVVDDEKSVLKVCAKMVNLCGFTVITAHDGIDAVNIFRENAEEIVAVLMDLTMPKMDGITAMNEIFCIRPDVKVILASGFNEEELSDRITSQPPSGFIRKPYNFNVLEEKLRSVVQAKPHYH